MNLKELYAAWDEAVQRAVLQRALQSERTSELGPEQLTRAAGLHVRSRLVSGLLLTISICTEEALGTIYTEDTVLPE